MFMNHQYSFPLIVNLQASPLRYVLKEIDHSILHPFGNSPAQNVLEGFDGCEPVEDDGTGLNVNI